MSLSVIARSLTNPVSCGLKWQAKPTLKGYVKNVTDLLKDKFWYCPDCKRLNLGAWCVCSKNKGDKDE
jgi:hypothetical protein